MWYTQYNIQFNAFIGSNHVEKWVNLQSNYTKANIFYFCTYRMCTLNRYTIWYGPHKCKEKTIQHNMTATSYLCYGNSVFAFVHRFKIWTIIPISYSNYYLKSYIDTGNVFYYLVHLEWAGIFDLFFYSEQCFNYKSHINNNKKTWKQISNNIGLYLQKRYKEKKLKNK